MERIAVPEGPANVTFGGDDYKTLFITARTSLYSVRMKNAGAKPVGAKW
jgi:gluconolactonase